MKDIEGKIRLHLWIESDRGMILGIGRVQLIEKIEKYGSLQTAAKKMGISYRAAWGRLKKTEEVLGCKLLERVSGKCRLTEQAKTLTELYQQWFKKVEDFAYEEASRVFPWKSVSFVDNEQDAR
jgi:molybdate transport system regulatory protein